MMRSWRKIGLSTALASVLVLQAAAPKAAAQQVPVDKVEELQKEVDSLKKSIQLLGKMNDKIERLHREVQDAQTNTELVRQDSLEVVRELKTEIAQMRADIEKLNKSLSTTRLSAFPPFAAAQAPTTGRIEMSNTYLMEVQIAVNGRLYRIPPDKVVLSEPVPAGPFTYEVLGIQTPVTRVLEAGKMHYVNVHPRQ